MMHIATGMMNELEEIYIARPNSQTGEKNFSASLRVLRMLDKCLSITTLIS